MSWPLVKPTAVQHNIIVAAGHELTILLVVYFSVLAWGINTLANKETTCSLKHAARHMLT